MKIIYRIAKTELFTLFYSPVAWLVLMIFAFQAGMEFTDSFGKCLKSQDLGYGLYNVTSRVFTGYSLFSNMLENLYLYLPLLTMGLVSREISSGSIKLLYSSPVSIVKIIFGKYLAMVVYCFTFIIILLSFIVFSGFTIKDLDYPALFSALLGFYLLICAYAAVGLFMSCLTSYQVVAAMGTLAVLAVLNFIGFVGQDIEFVREITYWLSISGRTNELMEGLICSEDVLYFVIVIFLFVSFSIFKLQAGVQRHTQLRTIGKYTLVSVFVVFLGYVSSRPVFMSYYDTTSTKRNTLTKNSQEIMSQLDGGLTLTTYCNILDDDFRYGSPDRVKFDAEQFSKYVRFKPEMKIKYVYYYDNVNNPGLYARYKGLSEKEIAQKMCKVRGYDFDMLLSPEEIKKIVDLSEEGNVFVRQIARENGQKTFLRLYDDNQRHPSETEITAAFKRLVVKAPKVGFLIGHGEREIARNRDKDYSAFVNNRRFRSSLINQGFEGVPLSFEDIDKVPEDIDIIVMADLRESLSDEEMKKLDEYIQRGGNMIILSDNERELVVNPVLKKFGVSVMPGILVQPKRDLVPDVIAGKITDDTKSISKIMYNVKRYGYDIAMPGASGLMQIADNGFALTPLITTEEEGSWNELQTTNFLEDSVVCNIDKGDVKGPFPIAFALNRTVGDKDQRVLVFGDSDFICNGELSRNRNKIAAANSSFIPGMFQWLSYDEYPVNTDRARPSDDKVYFKRGWIGILKFFYLLFLPVLIGGTGTALWYVRKSQ